MTKSPEPPVPADLDLTDFDYMPFGVNRLRNSDFSALATDAEFRAGVMLWAAAWHQIPASSLPDDDRLLCSLAGLGRDIATWTSVRGRALHGFVKCSDGLLYHHVIASYALGTAKTQNKNKARTEAATAARTAKRRAQEERDAERDVERNGDQLNRIEQNRNRGPSGPLRAREPELAFQSWNQMAAEAGLPEAQVLSKERRASIAKRLTECGGLDGWKVALEKVRGSRFLNGGGDRGWKADLDFVLQKKSFTKLMEGSYDDRRQNGTGRKLTNEESIEEGFRLFDEREERRRRGEGGGL